MERSADNYVAYHVHTMHSLLDSCTSYTDYVDYAVSLGQKAIAFTEHGKPIRWVQKKMYCDQRGIKYIHGVECYLTRTLSEKIRDNYHTILLAKDYDGVLEINKVISDSTDQEHFYYKNRITFDEFLKLSNHVIKISACLASPLNKLPVDDPYYERLVKHYDYLEIQPHNCDEQIAFNQNLAFLAQRYGKPLIAGTDAHSLNQYKAECRAILMAAKGQSYGDEDKLDLTYKTFDELVDLFREQDAIPEPLWRQAIYNTNVMADSVQEFDLDTSLKYPKLYGSSEADAEKLVDVSYQKLNKKLEDGVIPRAQEQAFLDAIQEELRVFRKIDMMGYILCMSELVSWCWEHGIPIGPARGSVGGSRVAYVTDIIDLNPEQWHTVFSRFANEDRKEVGDIDIDCIDTDRPRIFEYLINRFGQAYTARVPTWTTAADKECINIIGRGLHKLWVSNHHGIDEQQSPYSIQNMERVKAAYTNNPDDARAKYSDIFYYYDGIVGTTLSQSVHAAGIVVSPITLADHYGVFWKDGELLLNIDMDEIHEVSLVKFDLLALNNLGIIQDTCKLAGIPYPKSHQVNWDDQVVWQDMMRSPIGIFQFEGDYAFKLLRDFGAKSIFDMSLVTACIRPSGASYRNDLIAHKVHHNPSDIIDNLLANNNGYLIYQEDTIKFLQQICGMSGSEADNVRRAIGRKDMDRLQRALPTILDGYCSKSPQPRDIAEEEAKEFLRIIEDSASYQFGYNHSIGYCLIGYLCAWLRCYYPCEFITTYLNHAKNDADISNGAELAKIYGIAVTPPRFELSGPHYTCDRANRVISKGIASLKGYGEAVCQQLHVIGIKKLPNFVDSLEAMYQSGIKAAKIQPLINIDYFAVYGNIPELSRILSIFDQFRPAKLGGVKQVKKSSVEGTKLEAIIEAHGTGKTAKGAESKNYTIIDIVGFMRECEAYIKSLGLPDIDIKTKIQNQKEVFGYVDMVTGDKADRRKLFIMAVVPLKSRGGGAPWAYAIQGRSIGSGKETRLTVRSQVYKRLPIKENDIIYARDVQQDKKGYWNLWHYDKIG